MDKLYKVCAAGCGAVAAFFTGIPPLAWVLIAMMTLDYATGLMTGFAGVSSKTEGGRLSSRAAYDGLMRKAAILVVVLLAVLLDWAVASNAGIRFSAVTGATCMWFIASEGASVLENAAELGVPVPAVLRRALEIMRQGGGDESRDDGDS